MRVSESARLYAAHSAGLQAAHVTLGKHAAGSPPAQLGQYGEWTEPADRAGSPTRVNAKITTEGQRHFFGQTVWPTREGELEPFHAQPLSPTGLSQQKGHFEPGQQHLDDPGNLTPRSYARGRAEISSDQWRGGRPITPNAGRASAVGAQAQMAQNIFFGGTQAKNLISGESCLS